MQPVDLLNLLSNSELPLLNHALLKEISFICWHVTAEINQWMSAFYETEACHTGWLISHSGFLSKLHPNRKQLILYSKGPGLVSSCDYNKNQCLLFVKEYVFFRHIYYMPKVSYNKLSLCTSNPSIPLKRVVLLKASSLLDNIHLEWHLCPMWQWSNKHMYYIKLMYVDWKLVITTELQSMPQSCFSKTFISLLTFFVKWMNRSKCYLWMHSFFVIADE